MNIIDFLGWKVFKSHRRFAVIGDMQFVNGKWETVMRPFAIKGERVITFKKRKLARFLTKGAFWGFTALAFPFFTAGGDGVATFISLFK